MGNHSSKNNYSKDEIENWLWKILGAVPLLPVNPNLEVLRVLLKQKDGYHDVGTVHSLCKKGKDKKWLGKVVQPQRRRLFWKNKSSPSQEYLLPPRSIGQTTIFISDTKGALAKALLGPVYAAAWIEKAESMEVRILGSEVHEFKKEKWEEMIQHFDPDLGSSLLGYPDRHSHRELYIVQKVVLLSEIKITVSYKTNEGVGINIPTCFLHDGLKLTGGVRSTNGSSVIREFTLSNPETNQKLPVAFSAISYNYNQCGIRGKYGKETSVRPEDRRRSWRIKWRRWWLSR